MAWGFVKAAPTASGACTFTGGNTTGNSIVAFGFFHSQTTDPGTITPTDNESNTYTLVANGGSFDGNSNGWYKAWVAPVTGGSGSNNVVTIAGTTFCIAAEYSGLTNVVDTTVIGTAFGNLNITCATSNEAIVEVATFGGGGVTFASTNMTTRSTLINKQMVLGDMNSVSGVNGTDFTNGSAVSMGRVILALKANASSQYRSLMGVGI